MIAFADTSVVCALLHQQSTTLEAEILFSELKTPLTLSTLVAFEFRQSARLQSFRFSADRTQGWSARETERMLAQFDANIAAGAFVHGAINWPEVHALAEQYSHAHTIKRGHRTLDVLHVATAVHLHADLFCTVDRLQSELARTVGLRVRPARLRA
jgi:predicted nucleic acid-binding protein